jgi:hypothetical protein
MDIDLLVIGSGPSGQSAAIQRDLDIARRLAGLVRLRRAAVAFSVNSPGVAQRQRH